MSCFPCFGSQRSKKSLGRKEDSESKKGVPVAEVKDGDGENKFINAKAYNFRELATATKNFRQEFLLGEGGFGKVFKGTIQSSGQVVAVKQLDRHGVHASKEFLAEISALSLLHHPNLVNLVGYCADGDQRILVYEYMSGGSLESHLLENGSNKKPLDWFTRIKIASGAARGLEYLHEQANPPVVYGYLKASNILLDEEFNPKLSDIGLTKLSPSGDLIQGPSRIMGTYGYSAPEYTSTGEVTLKSDVYSFGVVLLEIITGRRAVDTTRPSDEQNLVTWAQPYFRDPKKFPDLADPNLDGQFMEKDLNQAVAVAAMCLQEEASVRPLISDVVTTLSFLTTIPPEGFYPPPPEATPSENQQDNYDQDDGDGKSLKDEEDTYSKQSDSDVSQEDDEGDDSDDSDVDVDSDDGNESDHQDDKSEDESTATTTEANSKSSHKSRLSTDEEESDTSSCTSSPRSLDASVPSRSINSSNICALSRKTSKKSQQLSTALSHKKSKKAANRSDLKGKSSRKASVEKYESFSKSSSRGSTTTTDENATLSSKSSSNIQQKQQPGMKE